MSLQRLIINTGDLTADGFKSVCDLDPGQLPAANNFLNYIGAVTGGNQSALLSFNVGAVQAYGTVTFASTGPADTQTGTLFGVTFTAVASGHTTGAANFTRHNTPATVATNFATAVNEYVAFNGMVSAAAVDGVVTVTAAVPGKIGNGLVMASVNWANTTVVSLANGTDGTAYSVDLR